jgi:hypothetical protein
MRIAKPMPKMRIIHASLWIIIMLIYLLGDVLRIISGDATIAMTGIKIRQFGWLGIALLMLIPILMIFLTLVLPLPASRWTNIIRRMISSCSSLVCCSISLLFGTPGIGSDRKITPTTQSCLLHYFNLNSKHHLT